MLLDVSVAANSTLENSDGSKRSSVAQIDGTQLESEPEILEDLCSNDILPAEDKPTSNVLLNDLISSTPLTSVTPVGEYYDNNHTIDFGTPKEHMLLVPCESESSSTFTSTNTTATASGSVSSTHAAYGPRHLGLLGKV